MSAHSVHKWQSLGTREGVKETRSNMQQYNKNGKSDRWVRINDRQNFSLSFVIVTSLIKKNARAIGILKKQFVSDRDSRRDRFMQM